MEIELPPEIRQEIRELIAAAEFPDEPTALVELVKIGLSYRYRRHPSPARPVDPGPQLPPAPGLPEDLNWGA